MIIRFNVLRIVFILAFAAMAARFFYLQIIEHDKYGKGVVIEVEGSIATISFKGDLKKLMKNHKAIRKV